MALVLVFRSTRPFSPFEFMIIEFGVNTRYGTNSDGVDEVLTGVVPYTNTGWNPYGMSYLFTIRSNWA